MSLRDGSAKMSKSDPSDMSRINLTDDADTTVSYTHLDVYKRQAASPFPIWR